jgi:hypothetical protein
MTRFLGILSLIGLTLANTAVNVNGHDGVFGVTSTVSTAGRRVSSAVSGAFDPRGGPLETQNGSELRRFRNQISNKSNTKSQQKSVRSVSKPIAMI